MKKRITVLAGIAVMVMALFCLCGTEPVFAKTIQEAREACESAGGTFTVNQVYSATSFSSSCTMPAGTTDGQTYNWTSADEAKLRCPAGYKIVSSSSQGAKYQCEGGVVSDGDGSGGNNGGGDNSGGSGTENGDSSGTINGSGTGITGNADNSDAVSDNGCGGTGNGVKTNLFGGGCVSGTDGIFMVLNVILNVLTWGIGIAGTLGIVITGIQYMTARDNATQMEKAKHRLIQIVIGLAIYAVMWAFLQWLLPGGIFGN